MKFTGIIRSAIVASSFLCIPWRWHCHVETCRNEVTAILGIVSAFGCYIKWKYQQLITSPTQTTLPSVISDNSTYLTHFSPCLNDINPPPVLPHTSIFNQNFQLVSW